jgi:peptidoglycan/xylan/chitin deacetylase (PgdA/CDA1 family)
MLTLPPTKSNPLVVLCYHRITDKIENQYDISVRNFEEQMSMLSMYGYESITLSQYDQWKKGNVSLPEKSVLITFDDGDKSVYVNARPIMEKYQFTAALFLVSDWLARPNALDHLMIKELLNNRYELGSHTVSHRSLLILKDPEVLGKELVGSKVLLEQLFAVEIQYLAYPFGHFDESISTLAKTSGYSGAFSIIPGMTGVDDDAFSVKRIMLVQDLELPLFKRLILGDKELLKWRWGVDIPLQRRAGLHYIADIEQQAIDAVDQWSLLNIPPKADPRPLAPTKILPAATQEY